MTAERDLWLHLAATPVEYLRTMLLRTLGLTLCLLPLTSLADDKPERPHTLIVGVGFSHWYGATFGAPPGFTTPSLTAAIEPGFRFLEVSLHYTLSMLELPLPGGTRGRVGFAAAAVVLKHELRTRGGRIALGGGPMGGVVHTPWGVGPMMGARLHAHYLIELRSGIALGPAVEARAALYGLPGSGLPIYSFRDGQLVPGHSDALIELNVAVAFF